MVTYRAPRAPRAHGKRIVSAAARREIERIEQLLSGSEPGPVGDAALAERERTWAALQSVEQRQPSLQLEVLRDGEP
ncbi:hypothetical protein [Stenotrophomonas oahuensis]|uniref:Uncharacterized protein n=1 Tax=Stenotrophomonas oahuensis TaxID=3003271 RepID=A0ABY9YPX8_9GAMM|nr:hypothetical protein [Stenotrophomonas sp. A5586]WNH52807.1 hypothetical protein PDM29_00620 [Stenotrophomonas sp. A5586]